MFKRFKKLIKSEHGAVSLEYIILALLVAILGIVAWQAAGQAIADKAVEIGTTVSGLPTG